MKIPHYFRCVIIAIFFIHIGYKTAYTQSQLEIIAGQLADTSINKYDQAYKVFDWITSNIQFDVKNKVADSPDGFSIDEVIKRGYGNSYHYAILFKAFCDILDINSFIVYGYLKNKQDRVDYYFYKSNYVWNVFQVDEKWYILDATAGSGYLIETSEVFSKIVYFFKGKPPFNTKEKFIQQKSPEYFDISPGEAIITYFPVDPTFQLMKHPVSLETFLTGKDSVVPYIDINGKLAIYQKKSTLDVNIKQGEKALQANCLNNFDLAHAKFKKANELYRPVSEVTKSNIHSQLYLANLYSKTDSLMNLHKEIVKNYHTGQISDLSSYIKQGRKTYNYINSDYRQSKKNLINKIRSYHNKTLSIYSKETNIYNTSQKIEEKKLPKVSGKTSVDEKLKLRDSLLLAEKQELIKDNKELLVQIQLNYNNLRNVSPKIQKQIVADKNKFLKYSDSLVTVIQTNNKVLLDSYFDSLVGTYYNIRSQFRLARQNMTSLNKVYNSHYSTNRTILSNISKSVDILHSKYRKHGDVDELKSEKDPLLDELDFVNKFNEKIAEFHSSFFEEQISNARQNNRDLKKLKKQTLSKIKYYNKYLNDCIATEKNIYNNEKKIISYMQRNARMKKGKIQSKINQFTSDFE